MAAKRVASGLARIPLWKREIPRHPLYYNGDPQRREFLPLFWMKIVQPTEKIPPNYVHFVVHPQMNKLDIKQYLEKIYKVPVLSVRTELRTKDIKEFKKVRGRFVESPQTAWREEEKYAYVQLKQDTFKYPDFFGEGGKTELMDREILRENSTKKTDKKLSRKTSSGGIPFWFSGRRIDPTDQQ